MFTGIKYSSDQGSFGGRLRAFVEPFFGVVVSLVISLRKWFGLIFVFQGMLVYGGQAYSNLENSSYGQVCMSSGN